MTAQSVSHPRRPLRQSARFLGVCAPKHNLSASRPCDATGREERGNEGEEGKKGSDLVGVLAAAWSDDGVDAVRMGMGMRMRMGIGMVMVMHDA